MEIFDKFKSLTVQELAEQISPSSSAFIELKKRGILRTKNVVGELGEYFAVQYYNDNSKLPNLSLAPPGVKNIDALSRDGEIYSIKTVSSRSGTTGSFWDPESIQNNIKKFDYLVIVILNNSYSVDVILQMTWNDFLENKRFNSRMNNYNISVTKKLIAEFHT
jgi:hypothetical protein